MVVQIITKKKQTKPTDLEFPVMCAFPDFINMS